MSSSPSAEPSKSEPSKSEPMGDVRRLPLSKVQQELMRGALAEVEAIAGQVQHRWRSRLNEEELISEGHLALVQAAQCFDPSRGVQFETFASYRVRGAMLSAMRKEASLNQRLVIGAHLDAWEFLSGQGGQIEGDPLRDSEADYKPHLAAFSDWLLASMFAGLVARLEREGGEDGLAARAMYAQAVAALREARSEMNDREQTLLRLHYDEGASLHRVAEELGISYASAKRYHTTVLGRLSVKLRRLGITEAVEEEP